MTEENTHTPLSLPAVKIIECDEDAPFDLFYQVPGSATPQGVKLTISPDVDGPGTMSVDTSTDTGSSISFDTYYRRSFTFTVPLLTTKAANEMMAYRDVQRLAATINAGHTVEMPDCTEIGMLTESAEEAILELADLVRNWGDGADTVVTWECAEWWADEEEMLIEKVKAEGWDQTELEEYLEIADCDGRPVHILGAEAYAEKIIGLASADHD